MVPLAVHGDGVPVIRVGKKGSKSCDAYSWQSIVASGTTLKVKHRIFGIFEDSKTTSAMDTIWDMIVWSLYFLYLGVWPTVDVHGAAFPAGSPEAMLAGSTLAGGFCGVVWILKGEFEHVAKNLYTRSYRANLCREWCSVDQGKYNLDFMLWPNYFEDDAKWKAMLFTIAEWEVLHTMHKIFSMGFLSHHNTEPDEFHCIYLGIAGYFLGSILALLCFVIIPQRPRENMEVVCECILKLYTSNDVPAQFGTLNLDMIFALGEAWGGIIIISYAAERVQK